MKTWTFLAAAVAGFAFSLPAFSQTQATTRPVGETLATMQQKFAGKCEADRQALTTAKPEDVAKASMSRDMDCDCMPAATDAAFPPEMRSTQLAMMPFLARMNGAADVCVARSVRTTMDAECAKGNDPLAQKGSVSTTAVTAARCACLRSELAKTADANFADAANAGAARFDAIMKSNGGPQSQEPPRAGSFLPALAQICRAAGASTK